MKKVSLPILTFFLLLFLLPVFSPPANAQPKTVATCEEWKDIYATDTCRTAAHFQNKKEIWCYDPKEAESYPGGTGKYVGDYLLYRPPTHIVEFDYDPCIEEWGKEKGYSSPTTKSDQAQDSKSVFFIPSKLINAVLNIFKSRTKTAPKTQQVETPKQETKSATQTIDEWIMENHLEYNPDKIEQMEKERNEAFQKKAQLKEVMFEKAQQVWKLEMIKLQSESLVGSTFELLWEGQWPDVKTAVFDAQSGVIIASDSWKNIYLQELADQITKNMIINQGEMEIKVINENPTEHKVSVEVGDFFDIFVIQTHFRVKYDPDKKLGVINVYEGEVELRTKDGKVAKIRPNGDTPGVIVVTQKLSVTKLIVASLALVGILVGAILIVKRRHRLSTSGKVGKKYKN